MSLEAWGDEGPDYGWTDEAVEKAKEEAVQEYISFIANYFYMNLSAGALYNLKDNCKGLAPQELKDLLTALDKVENDGP